MAPCRLLASHTYARTRGRVGDTPRSTSSKNVLKANTCILRRLGYPPPSDSPLRLSFLPAAHVYIFRHSGEDTFAKPRPSMFYFLLYRYIRHYLHVHACTFDRESISKFPGRLMMTLIFLKCSNSKLWGGTENIRKIHQRYFRRILLEMELCVILVMHTYMIRCESE